MDLKGKIENITYGLTGRPQLTISLDQTAKVNEVIDYNQEQIKLKITKAGQSRTIRQNNLLWGIIADIDKGENEIPTESGRMDIYITGIAELGVDYEDYKIPEKAVPIFKKGFRACKVIGKYGNDVIIRCFTGSSKFNKKEMGELIDWFIRYAAQMQIPIRDYMNEWQELYG